MRVRRTVLRAALVAAPLPVMGQTDWPSYNRTLTSERFAPLAALDATTAPTLRVVCSYDTGQMTAFDSGLVQVDGALFGDMGGTLYALDSGTGATLWSQNLGDAVAGGVITYDTGAGQKLAVATGMTSKIWPTAKGTARVYMLGAP